MKSIRYHPAVGSKLYDRCRRQAIIDAGVAATARLSSQGMWSNRWGQQPIPFGTIDLDGPPLPRGLSYHASRPMNPVIGDCYTDNMTDWTFFWDGQEWLHHPGVTGSHTTRMNGKNITQQLFDHIAVNDRIPPNEVWIGNLDQYGDA